MKYFSLFTGVGGFELGIENAYGNYLGRTTSSSSTKDGRHLSLPESSDGDGRRSDACCVGFSEIDKYASRVLKHRFPNVKNYGDITKINWAEVPDFDLLVGGSPCQSFSIAGKRAGFNGASGLFWGYLRCLNEKKPEHFIWENVKGVLSSNHGYDFANIINAFSEAGYALWWQVLNAKDFGIPQNRERIFVVGSRSGSPREILFERGGIPKNPVAHDTGEIYEQTKRLSDAFRIRSVDGASATLKGLGGGMGAKTGLYATPRIRRLTPTECERLMSWPDDWTRYGIDEEGGLVEMSDTQRYKMCGNGVVSKVVEELIKAHLCPTKHP